jgi:hypothetical protein
MAEGSITDTVVNAMMSSISSRNEAAELLHLVAELGSSGNFPGDVSGELLGRAIFRIAMNSPEPDAVIKIITGLLDAHKEFMQRLGAWEFVPTPQD